MKNLHPDINLTNAREYYGAYDSRDLKKGKSFNMAGEWKSGTHYWNDEYVSDFVSYKGTLLSCKKSHLADSNNEPILVMQDVDGIAVPCGIKNNIYWTFVIGSVPGADGEGKQGPPGKDGDQNIWFGTTVPKNEDGTVDYTKIWYDPSDFSSENLFTDFWTGTETQVYVDHKMEEVNTSISDTKKYVDNKTEEIAQSVNNLDSKWDWAEL